MARDVYTSALRAGQESAQYASRVVVVDEDDVAILSSNPDDGVPVLAIESGSVTLDDTAAIKGTADVTISIDKEHEHLVPTGAGDVLSPISNVMVRIYVGALDPSTLEPKLAKIGKFEIVDVEIVEDGNGLTLKLSLEDNWKKLERARFYKARKIDKGTNYEDAIRFLMVSVLPNQTIYMTPTVHTTPLLTWDIENERVPAIQSMLESIGYMMRMDGDGDPQGHPDTDPTDDPVWSFAEGEGTRIATVGGFAKVTKTTRRLSDEKTYNGVVVRGEATGDNKPPVSAEAWDTNPNSLTYYDPTKPEESSYGPVPFFYTSPLITTAAQAASAARSRLPKVLGVVERLEVVTLPNAGVEPGDPVQVDRPRIGASGTFIVESVVLPLKAGEMQVGLRERRIFA